MLVQRVHHTMMPNAPRVFSKQYGCDHSIRIFVLDPDGDRIRCRMATGTECLSVCDALPGVIVDEVGSTWSFVFFLYPVAQSMTFCYVYMYVHISQSLCLHRIIQCKPREQTTLTCVYVCVYLSIWLIKSTITIYSAALVNDR